MISNRNGDVEIAQAIWLDLSKGISPDDSKLDYGPLELKLRKEMEQEFAEYKKKNPKAFMHIPD